MPTFVKTASILAASLLTAGGALADSRHHGGNTGGAHMGDEKPQMEGNRHEMMMKHMMHKMMQMHGGGAGRNVMSRMDRDMMRTMMGADMMDGMPGKKMQAGLKDYDADGDGTLSLDEFSVWHAAMLRETMVDRFQHLDADGDGAITSDEMSAIANRMKRMNGKGMHGNGMNDGGMHGTGMGGHQMMQGMSDQE